MSSRPKSYQRWWSSFGCSNGFFARTTLCCATRQVPTIIQYYIVWFLSKGLLLFNMYFVLLFGSVYFDDFSSRSQPQPPGCSHNRKFSQKSLSAVTAAAAEEEQSFKVNFGFFQFFHGCFFTFFFLYSKFFSLFQLTRSCGCGCGCGWSWAKF